MTLSSLIDFFIHPYYHDQPVMLRKARLLVRGCLLTSFFSVSYVWLSVVFEYPKGVYLMIINVVGFLLLPLLLKTKMPLAWLGNMYIFLGSAAVLILTYFSGGIDSAIYPWIVCIPLLALLLVNKLSGAVWGAISIAAMVGFGVLAMRGVELPVEYNTDLRPMWFTSVLTGLLLIILFVGFVFEFVQTRALLEVERKNEILEKQKDTITSQSQSLERLIEEKDYIIKILAHDLRSPLGNINGLASLLDSKRQMNEQREFVTLMKQAASDALHLVERVLEMDQADQGDLKLDIQAVNVSDELSAIIESMGEAAARKKIDVVLHAECTNCVLQSDRIYLGLVFENLLSNALKFSEQNTRVLVEVTNGAESVTVKVTDEGPGILPHEEGRLFKKFSRLSARPTAHESSSGLGLSLVKRYVELLGGKIWHERPPSAGATFAVELPLVYAQHGEVGTP